LDSDRSRHLGIKGFRLTWSAVQKQKDHGLVFEYGWSGFRVSFPLQKVSQLQSTKPQGAGLQEFSTA
jgi:hypothetical protein